MRKLFLILLCSSCSVSGEYTALKPVGYVQGVTPSGVTVCYPVAYSDRGHSVGCTRYDLPGGHEYKEGDFYPDPNKYAFHFNNYTTNNKKP
jgi:hypothetical protein